MYPHIRVTNSAIMRASLNGFKKARAPLIVLPSWVTYNSHYVNSVPILGYTQFTLCKFYSHLGLHVIHIMLIPFPSWVVRDLHYVNSIPILGYVILIMIILFPSWVYVIHIMLIVFSSWVVCDSHC